MIRRAGAGDADAVTDGESGADSDNDRRGVACQLRREMIK